MLADDEWLEMQRKANAKICFCGHAMRDHGCNGEGGLKPSSDCGHNACNCKGFQAKPDTLVTLEGLACDHSGMDECHPGCGHFACPCGVSWDEGAFGPQDDDELKDE